LSFQSDHMGFYRRCVATIAGVCLMLLSVSAISATACDQAKSVPVHYSGGEREDTLTVSVAGDPCSKATVKITVDRADGVRIYNYQGSFIEHMPFLIYEPDLSHLVVFFLDKVLNVAMQQTTADLHEYSGVESFYEATNNFVVVPLPEYQALRNSDKVQSLLWHATGDASWMHAVYDPKTQSSRVIMRGGVFE